MADQTVKHFIIMRFFPKQDINYLYNVLHKGFLIKQLNLAVNNGLKSLENQTDKNFEIVFYVNDKLFVDESYKFIFSTLRDAVTVPVRFPKRGEYKTWVQEAYDKYDFVIQSRMDFDDFLHKDAIADTHEKIDECENILLYGYCKGYLYSDGTLRHMFYPSRGIGHHSILQSEIWKSSFAPKLPFFDSYFSGHHRAKQKLKEIVEQSGVEFSESMFQQNTTMDAFIYFRHEFSHFIISHNGAPDTWIVDQGEVTAEEITKKQLAEDFGFAHVLKSIE